MNHRLFLSKPSRARFFGFLLSLTCFLDSSRTVPIASLSLAAADDLVPRVCIGYNPDAKNWEPVGATPAHIQEQNCPSGYAYMRTSIITGTPRPGANLALRGSCCPLPAGVLTEEHVWNTDRCPEGFVATGSRAERQVYFEGDNWRPAVAEWEKILHYMRCTKINTARFQLGPVAETLTVGLRRDFPRKLHEVRMTSESRIPVGIRYGVTRDGKYSFEAGGCLGLPWGSLLTAKFDKFCGIEFRPLQYTGAPGDPPAGTPVQVVPDCLSIDDPLSPEPKCLKP